MRLGSSPEKRNVKLSCPSNCFVGFHLFCFKTCRKPNRHHSTLLGMTNKKNSELETRQTDCSCTLFLFQQPPNLFCILFKHSEWNTMFPNSYFDDREHYHAFPISAYLSTTIFKILHDLHHRLRKNPALHMMQKNSISR